MPLDSFVSNHWRGRPLRAEIDVDALFHNAKALKSGLARLTQLASGGSVRCAAGRVPVVGRVRTVDLHVTGGKPAGAQTFFFPLALKATIGSG